MVDVKPQLTTEVDYAYNSEGEKVKGTWEFVAWDKDDFEITEDTTVTGGWRFTPAPEKTYTYIVHYKLYISPSDMDRVVHADTTGTVKALGDKVKIDALPVQSLNKQYKNPSKYEIRPGFEHMEVTIDYNNYQINIWYQPKNTGMVANPNSVVTSGIKDEKEEVIEEEKAEIVEADEKEEIVEEEQKEEIVFFGMV